MHSIIIVIDIVTANGLCKFVELDTTGKYVTDKFWIVDIFQEIT